MTDDRILKIVRKTLKDGNDKDKLSPESFIKLARAILADSKPKCIACEGRPVYPNLPCALCGTA